MILTVLKEIEDLFKKKQQEYKGETKDNYRNFNQGAMLASELPQQTLLGYAEKQVVSLYDAKMNHVDRLNDITFIEEKAKDIALYMIILIAMVRELNTKKRREDNNATN